jgi:hypothetical protein
MTVRVYKSTDASAPVLSSTAGALIAVLDACLVNGYGSKTAAGWTKDYSSGTNFAVYRPSLGNRFQLDVNDSFSNYARVASYESMTGIGVGIGKCPTEGQLSGGLYMLKTDNVAGNRDWVVIANERCFYFWTRLDTNANGINGVMSFFGDIISNKTNDAYGTMLIASDRNIVPAGVNWSTNAILDRIGLQNQLNYAISGHYIQRAWHGLGTSAQAGKLGHAATAPRFSDGVNYASSSNPYPYPCVNNNESWPLTYPSIGNFGLNFPNVSDGGILLYQPLIHEPSHRTIRGKLPGFYHDIHGGPYLHDTDVVGSGDTAGRTFKSISLYSSLCLVETSDTWYV